MVIAFILASVDISGGTYVLFEHAVRLQKYENNDIYILTKVKVDKNDLLWHTDAKFLNYKTFDDVKDIKFDIAIATWWKTAFFLQFIDANHYAYFVQSIESKFYPQVEKPLHQFVESTYTLNLPIITEAKWIREYLKKSYFSNINLVHNGIRKDLYNLEIKPIDSRKSSQLRVLVEGPLGVDFKNVENTIKICSKSLVDEIWFLTSSDISSYKGVDKVFSRVPINEVGRIYASCDVIVKLSYVEGMFGPPLEMFHCGGTAIVYNVSGHDEYIKHKVNGFVVDRDDEEQVIEYINLLKKDVLLLEKLKQNAIKTAGEWIDWNESSQRFYQALQKINNSDLGKLDKNYLGMLTVFYEKQYILAEEYKTIANDNKIKTKIKFFLKRYFPKSLQYVENIKNKLA